MSENGGLGRWVGGILATVIAGVLVALIVSELDGGDGGTPEPGPDTNTAEPQPATRIEALSGNWALVGWDEAPSDITLGMEPINGILQVTADGTVSWEVDIDDLFWEDTGPQATVSCSGRIPLTGRVDARVTHEGDYTSNMMSAREGIAAAFCGGGTTAGNHPFTITYAPESAPTRLEMVNDLGRFIWER